MAVVVQTAGGCIVDHLQASTATVSRLHSSNNEGCILVPYRLKSGLFEIWEPYRMDSQFEKLHSTCGQVGQTRKRKRRRQEMLNCGEQMAQDYHIVVKDCVSEVYQSLVGLGRQMTYFHERDTSSSTDNNVTARQAALCAGSSQAFTEMCQQSRNQTIFTCQLTTDTDMSDCGMVDIIWQHSGDQSVMMQYKGDNYIVPPHSEFLMSDIQQLHTATDALGTYDLVVMDPPWTNKSVKRKKKYYTMENDSLLDLQLHDLMNPGALVVVWVTNKQKHIHFVTEQLFPKHHIQFLTRWYWLKVTKTGQCVFDLDSPHKKPYETLIIGKMIPKCIDVARSQETLHNRSFSNYKCENEAVTSLITDKMGIICCQHMTDQDSNQKNNKHESNVCACSADSNHGNSSVISSYQVTVSNYRSSSDSPSNQVIASNHGNSSVVPSNQVTVSNHRNSSCVHANQATICNHGNSSDIHANQATICNHGNSSAIHANQATICNHGNSSDIHDNQATICNHGNSSAIPSTSNHGHRSAIPSSQANTSNHGNSSAITSSQATICNHGNSSAITSSQANTSNHGNSSAITSSQANTCSHGHSSAIPDEHVIISIPCSLHSKKPPLSEVLKPHLPDKPRCLELFARNLLPYWTSWGNEVLLHQHEDLFEEIT